MASDVFMSICPRSENYIGCNIQGVRLRVVMSDGVKVTPDINFDGVD